MSYEVRIFLGNFTESDVVVGIEKDLHIVPPRSCPFVQRELRDGPVSVRIGFMGDKVKFSMERDFDFELNRSVSFCEYQGELRFFEVKQLHPRLDLMLLD